MAANKYPGKCQCGSHVAAGAGRCEKRGARWMVICANCDASAAREHLGSIEWPNGLGFTPCTIEYEEAVAALRDAAEAHERAPSSETYDAHCRAEQRVLSLQAEGGHLGEPVRLDRYDPVVALMGGGSVSAAELRAALAAEG